MEAQDLEKQTHYFISIISHQPYIDKIYLYGKDLHETKYQVLVDKMKSTGIKHFNDSKAFIEHTKDMDDIYKSTEQYNSNKKH